MEQINRMKKPEITQPGGFLSQYGGYTGFKNHYYAMRPDLWAKQVGIKVDKNELDVSEPDQQGADPKERFKKTTYKAKSVDILQDIRFENSNVIEPEGIDETVREIDNTHYTAKYDNTPARTSGGYKFTSKQSKTKF